MTNQPNIGLATGWETSADGKVWTFTITDKATWQDGEPLTASDVAFTFNYILDNNLGMFIDYLNFIDKVEAPDATHVVFTCSQAQGQHACPVDPDPARAHLEQGQPQGR